MFTLHVWTPLPILSSLTQRQKMDCNGFDSLTDNTVAARCGFCIFPGRRHQWRHSAAVTVAGKLVISNLVYLSPLQWGWSLSPSDYVRQQHAPWASSPELFSSRVARASVVLFIFNKITGVRKLFPRVCVLWRLLNTLDLVTTYWRCISFHFMSLRSPVLHWPLEIDWVPHHRWHLNSLNSARRSKERLE